MNQVPTGPITFGWYPPLNAVAMGVNEFDVQVDSNYHKVLPAHKGMNTLVAGPFGLGSHTIQVRACNVNGCGEPASLTFEEIPMEVAQGVKVTMKVQHDGVNTEEYALYLDDALHGTKPMEPAGVEWVFEEGLEVGAHQAYVKAIGPGGANDSDPVLITVTVGVPSKPVLLVIVGDENA